MDMAERRKIEHDLGYAKNCLWNAEHAHDQIKSGDGSLEYMKSKAGQPIAMKEPNKATLDKVYNDAFDEEMKNHHLQYNGGIMHYYGKYCCTVAMVFGVACLLVALIILTGIVPQITEMASVLAELFAGMEGMEGAVSADTFQYGFGLVAGVFGAIFLAAGIIVKKKIKASIEAERKRREDAARAEAANKANAAVEKRQNEYAKKKTAKEKEKKDYKAYDAEWKVKRPKLVEVMEENAQKAQTIMDAYDIPYQFRNFQAMQKIYELFSQQVVSTFQEAYAQVRMENHAEEMHKLDIQLQRDKMNMEFEMQRQRDQDAADERRRQREYDRMHREKLEKAAWDLAYEERRAADALEDIKRKLDN